jgi:hypothetical protein
MSRALDLPFPSNGPSGSAVLRDGKPSVPSRSVFVNISVSGKAHFMHRRSLVGALGVATFVLSAAAVAGAQPAPPSYRQQSLANVARFAEHTQKMIGNLQRDARDYGGHRVAAINALQNAANELNAAAQFAEAHGYQMPVQQPPRNPNPYRRPKVSSDTDMQKAQMATGHMIERLQSDSRDFGGHRAAAIDALRQANAELTAAVQFAAAHGN